MNQYCRGIPVESIRENPGIEGTLTSLDDWAITAACFVLEQAEGIPDGSGV
jgi:hypothetical protein